MPLNSSRKELKTTACRSSRRIRDAQSRPDTSSALLPCQGGFSGHDRSNAEAQVWIGSVSDLACDPITAKMLSEARTPLTSFHLMPSGPDALAMHILLVVVRCLAFDLDRMGEVIMVMCLTLRVSQPARSSSLPLSRPECCRFCCRRHHYFFSIRSDTSPVTQ
ncbi:hypothetical protein BO79DRAFT_224756 [Aspergillus costaricaensis CBS 115574]|uniref:Uncharacterized protein n=1 Tax=Aspergillus costaricaensis CBS 115574 TaxID=1448317 RepID=A0ACD1IT59_9EURO|nr:hypothetical protein BO79DRAFT_224756 [Aspergillus costaricaensis CBS 115574]RAK93253.1 hypothetical protein BO79DRAFT_224756 [Aspergillus costaricaensis CBS 115574]